VRGYHAVNILIHALSALVLMGLVRRTLMLPWWREKWGGAATLLGFTVALLWALHPLLTESVTGVIQRTESMGGLFYLLTLYAFARSGQSRCPLGWLVVSVGACLVGMATKEIMATVPVIALLYDRTFVSGTFRAAWRRHGRYYGALASTWLLLAYLVIANESRGGLVGFGQRMSSWDYALTQCQAIVLYLKLSIWPSPLVVDYGAEVAKGVSEVWMQGVVVLALVAGTFYALVQRPIIGFVAFTFFAILAPSSSFIPLTTQTIAEHRMYLPLACVVGFLVVGLASRGQRWVVPVALALALLAGIATVRRNQDYRSAQALWADTVAKNPGNARARVNLGTALAEHGQTKAALAEFSEAVKLKPFYSDAAYNLGNALLELERFAEATGHLETAVRLNPRYVMAHYALGYCLVRTDRVGEGLRHYQQANELLPRNPTILHSYASTLVFAGRHDEARDRYEEALKLTPGDPSLHQESGLLAAQMGDFQTAISSLQISVQLAPGNLMGRQSLGLLFMRFDRCAEAAEQFGAVVRRQPDFPEARYELGRALLGLERWAEAEAQFVAALRLRSNYPEARENLERAQLMRDLRR